MKSTVDTLIVLGASAGGLQSLKNFLSVYEVAANTSIFVLQHLLPGGKDEFAKLLGSYTKAPVKSPGRGGVLKPKQVYVCPSGKQMRIGADKKLHVTTLTTQKGAWPSIDTFVLSAVKVFKSRILFIVFSGAGSDGLKGATALQKAGGHVWVQDPLVSSHADMPKAIVQNGLDSLSAEASQMAELLNEYNVDKKLTLNRLKKGQSEVYALIGKEFEERFGLSIADYKKSSLLRLFYQMMQKKGYDNESAFLVQLQKDPSLRLLLARHMFIHVSSFFRDSGVFASLEKTLRQELRNRTVTNYTVISLGSALGQEAYSIAILLQEVAAALNIKTRCHVYAYDIDEEAVRQARKGCFTFGQLDGLGSERIEHYFTLTQEGYKPAPQLQNSVTFAFADALKPLPVAGADLILCRNLLIYLTYDAQKKVLSRIYDSLREEGIFISGKSENINALDRRFDAIDNEAKIYRKKVPSVKEDIQERTSRNAAVIKPNFVTGGDEKVLILDSKYTVIYAAGYFKSAKKSAIPAGSDIDELFDVLLGQKVRTIALTLGMDQSIQSDFFVIRGYLQKPWVVQLTVKKYSRDGAQMLGVKVGEHDLSQFAQLFKSASLKQEVLRQSKENEKNQYEKLLQAYDRKDKEQKKQLEQLDVVNEELESTNEELNNTNEELNNANEELETANDQLQNALEETRQLNAKLQETREQLQRNYTRQKQLQQRYTLAIEGANDVIWDWDINNDTLYLPSRYSGLFEIRAKIASLAGWIKRIDRNYRDDFYLALQNHLEQKSSYFEHSHPLILPKGGRKWVRVRGKAVFENRTPVRMAGSISDIDAQYKAHIALQERFKELQCTFMIAKYRIRYEHDLDTLLQKSAYAIAEGMQDPGNTSVKITVENKEYKTKSFRAYKYSMSAPLQRGDKSVGLLLVRSKKAFLHEEQTLLDNIAAQLSFAYANEMDYIAAENIRKRYDQAIKEANDGLWDWNIDTGQMYFSPRWKEILGYSDSELENSFATFVALIHPDDADKTVKKLKAHTRSGKKNFKIEFRMRHKNGHYLSILSVGKRIGKAQQRRLIGFHVDISDKQKLVYELDNTMVKYRKIFNNVKDIVMLIDEQSGEIVEMNKAAREHFGSVQNVGGEPMFHFEKRKPLDWHNHLQQTKQRGSITSEATSVDKTGKTYHFVVTCSTLKTDKTYHFTTAYDITKQYEAMEQLQQNQELMLLQSRQAAMGEMISMIAHQWRQPISVISMVANNILADLQMDNLDKQVLETSLLDINHQVQHMSKTIDDFRDFFKPKKERVQITAGQIVDKTVDIVGSSLQNNNITLEVSGERDIVFETYDRELVQVLLNIISNAKDALQKATAEKKIIKIEISKEQNSLCFCIKNNGEAIKKRNLAKIFDPYFSTKDEKNGSGLGLYMARSIVQKHMKGSIEAANEGGWVLFRIKVAL